MPTEIDKKKRAELEKWLVKINPELAKQLRDSAQWWEEQERNDPTNKELKKQGDKNLDQLVGVAKGEAAREAPGREKAAKMFKGGDIQEAEKLVQKITTRANLSIDHYWNNYGTALTRTQFGVDANTPEEISDEDMDLLESLARKTFGAVIELSHLEEAKEILGCIAKNLVDLTGDIKGKRASNGKAELNAYIDSLASSVEDQREQMKLQIDKGSETVMNKYKSLMSSGEVDQAKTYLDTVLKDAESFEKALESFTQDKFKQLFLTAFVGKREMGEGNQPTGTIYFRLYLTLESDGQSIPQWGIKDKTSPAWKLVTKRENPEGLAKTLISSVESGKPWQINLEKRVYIDVEIITSGAADAIAVVSLLGGVVTKSLDKHHEGMIIFKESPGNFVTRAPAEAQQLIKKAWDDPEIRARALNTKDLVGSDK